MLAVIGFVLTVELALTPDITARSGGQTANSFTMNSYIAKSNNDIKSTFFYVTDPDGRTQSVGEKTPTGVNDRNHAYTFENVFPGTYKFQAVAVDAKDKSSYSSWITVTVVYAGDPVAGNDNGNDISASERLSGGYQGRYISGDGNYWGATFNIYENEDGFLVTQVDCYGDPENPEAADWDYGTWLCLVDYDENSDTYAITASQWIDNPGGWSMDSFLGCALSEDGNTLSGEVFLNSERVSTFEFSRIDIAPPISASRVASQDDIPVPVIIIMAIGALSILTASIVGWKKGKKLRREYILEFGRVRAFFFALGIICVFDLIIFAPMILRELTGEIPKLSELYQNPNQNFALLAPMMVYVIFVLITVFIGIYTKIRSTKKGVLFSMFLVGMGDLAKGLVCITIIGIVVLRLTGALDFNKAVDNQYGGTKKVTEELIEIDIA